MNLMMVGKDMIKSASSEAESRSQVEIGGSRKMGSNIYVLAAVHGIHISWTRVALANAYTYSTYF